MRRSRSLLIALASLLFALVFPLAFRRLYHGDFPLWLLVPLVGLKTTLYYLVHTSEGRRRVVWTALSWSLTLLYAGLVLASILITPYSSYRFWLENVKSGEAEGTVSNLLVILVALFATMTSQLFFRRAFLWAVLTMALVASSLAAFIYQSDASLLAVLAAVALFFGYLAYSSGYRGSRVRRLGQLGSLAACSLLLAALATGSGTPTGSRVVDLRLYPWLREQVLVVFPRFPLLYAIPGYGYSFNETKRLGGTPVLSEAAIFEVETPQRDRLYLRTRSYDTYDGKTWQLASERDDSSGTLLLYESRAPEPNEVHVKLVAEYYSMVPHTLDTVRVRFDTAPPAVQSGDKGIGVLLARPVKRNTVMHLQRGPQQEPRRPRNLGVYLQVPPDLPDTVRTLAGRLGEGTDDPRIVLKRIEQYLALNYTYSLEVEETGAYTGDFVTDFLFSELQGYCVQFASSFALLARLNGIPTRYATGFLVIPTKEGGPVSVTGLNAHAWPEVWLEDSGWTIYEATPALNPLNWEFIEDNWLYNLSLRENNLTNQQLRQVLGARPAPKPRPPQEARGFPAGWALAAAALAVLAALAALAGPAFVRSLEMARADRVGFMLRVRSIVRALKRRGVAGPELTGWIAWGERLEREFSLRNGAARRAVRLIIETVYGHRVPRTRDLRFVQSLRRRLTRRASSSPAVRTGLGQAAAAVGEGAAHRRRSGRSEP